MLKKHRRTNTVSCLPTIPAFLRPSRAPITFRFVSPQLSSSRSLQCLSNLKKKLEEKKRINTLENFPPRFPKFSAPKTLFTSRCTFLRNVINFSDLFHRRDTDSLPHQSIFSRHSWRWYFRIFFFVNDILWPLHRKEKKQCHCDAMYVFVWKWFQNVITWMTIRIYSESYYHQSLSSHVLFLSVLPRVILFSRVPPTCESVSGHPSTIKRVQQQLPRRIQENTSIPRPLRKAEEASYRSLCASRFPIFLRKKV